MAFKGYAILRIRGRNYKLYSKRDLKTEKWQEILKDDHTKKMHPDPRVRKKFRQVNSSKYGRIIKCVLCNVPMHTAYKKELGYYLVTRRGHKIRHRWDCIFFDDSYDSIYDKDGNLSLKSSFITFGKPRDIPIPKSHFRPYYIKMDREDEESLREINRFSQFMRNIIDQAYAASFNFLNKGKDRLSGDLVVPEMSYYLRVFRDILFATPIRKPKTTFGEYRKEKGFSVKAGILESYMKVGEDSKWVEYKDLNESFTRKVPVWMWEYGAGATKIYNNTIPPPYLYVKIYKGREIYRFYLFPVAISSHFIPVESDLERQFLSNLFLEYGVAVYKPLTVYYINRVLTSGYAKIFYSKVDIPDRPDAFVFYPDKIQVLEIANKGNMKGNFDYKQNLERKEKGYKALPYPFEYQRIIF